VHLVKTIILVFELDVENLACSVSCGIGWNLDCDEI
jgi:hypothetical protein